MPFSALAGRSHNSAGCSFNRLIKYKYKFKYKYKYMMHVCALAGRSHNSAGCSDNWAMLLSPSLFLSTGQVHILCALHRMLQTIVELIQVGMQIQEIKVQKQKYNFHWPGPHMLCCTECNKL